MQGIQGDYHAHQLAFGRSASCSNFPHAAFGSRQCNSLGSPTYPGLWRIWQSRTCAPKLYPIPGATLRVQHTTQPTSNASACYYLETATVHKDVSPIILTLLLRPLNFEICSPVPDLYTTYFVALKQVLRGQRKQTQHGFSLQQARQCRRRDFPRHCGGHVRGLRRRKLCPSRHSPVATVTASSQA